MWDALEPAAVDGLRYLKALGAQPVRPSAEMFQAFLNQPRPEKKSLTEALKASKGPSGSDILEWMLYIGWVQIEEVGDTEQVGITDLGLAVLNAATATDEVETELVEVVDETPEVEVPDLAEVTLTVEETVDDPTEQIEEPEAIFG